MTHDPNDSTNGIGAEEPALVQGDRPTNVRWTVFGLSCFTSFLLYLHRYTWGFMKADVAEEFGWDTVTLGFLDSAFGLSYGMGQIPFGIAGDWFGPRMVLGSIIGLWSLAMWTTIFAVGIWSMLAARFVFGLAQAGCYSNLAKTTKLWFPLTVRTTVQGCVASFSGRSGGAASNLLFGTLMMGVFHMPWRIAISVLAVLGVAFAGIFFWAFRNRPAEHPLANQAEADLITATDPAAAVATKSTLKWGKALKSGNLRVLLFQQFTSAFVDNLYPYWIPLFLLIEKGVEYSTAGVLAALPLMGGAVGGMTGGFLQNSLILRTGNRRWSRSSVGLTGKLLAAVFMFASLGFDSATTILCLFGVVKFFSDWSQPTVWGTCTDIGGRSSATVFSVVNTIGSVAGVLAGPIMGAVVLFFSQDISVQAERALVAETNANVTLFAPLQQRALVQETVTGTVYDAGREVARFETAKTGTLKFTSVSAEGSYPLEDGSKIHLNKGELTLNWSEPPSDATVVIDYTYRDYGSGWTALFISLAVIYAASALAWLFIDCTKPLEPEADLIEDSGEPEAA